MLGTLKKMRVERNEPVSYFLPLGDVHVPLQPFLGKTLHLHYTGEIFCTACGRKTSKSFSQGYCYPCMKKLAECDMCILKPETCHYHLGTCREPAWGEANCMIGHIVYLANSSGLKVGITRESQVPTRWIDQGATQALPIFRVASRFQSGLIEVVLAQYIADKTNWQALVKGDAEPIDLVAARDRLLADCCEEIAAVQARFPEQIVPLDASIETFIYPVLQYPTKVKALSFDTTADVSGTLTGIKGQYLLLDTGVINIRKFTAYQVELLTV
jgi:hypothetical protein